MTPLANDEDGGRTAQRLRSLSPSSPSIHKVRSESAAAQLNLLINLHQLSKARADMCARVCEGISAHGSHIHFAH